MTHLLSLAHSYWETLTCIIYFLANGKQWLLPTLQLPDLRKDKVKPKRRTSVHHSRGMWMMLFTCFKSLFCGLEGGKRQILVGILNTCGAKERRVKTKDCIMIGTYWTPRDEGKGNVRGGTWGTSSSRYQGNEVIESKLSQGKENQQMPQEMTTAVPRMP